MLKSIDDLSQVPGPVHLAIGVFDGIHLGHQAVIKMALAQSPGTPVVVTFDPHPARLLRPDRAPRMLTSTRHKLSILERLGVSCTLVLAFDAAFASTEAEEFVAQLQSACRPLGSIAVGDDWTFGRQARGSVALLKSMGLTVHAVAPVQINGFIARSTGVRQALENGDLSLAARLLGRPATVLGTVVAGRKLGRTIGFPTANLALDSEQLPPNGVYAVRALLNTRTLAGVANLGFRPTVETGSPERRLEVHLFDFDQEIYGADLEVEWVSFVRPEENFPSLEALTTQIQHDVVQARKILESAPTMGPPQGGWMAGERQPASGERT